MHCNELLCFISISFLPARHSSSCIWIWCHLMFIFAGWQVIEWGGSDLAVAWPWWHDHEGNELLPVFQYLVTFTSFNIVVMIVMTLFSFSIRSMTCREEWGLNMWQCHGHEGMHVRWSWWWTFVIVMYTFHDSFSFFVMALMTSFLQSNRLVIHGFVSWRRWLCDDVDNETTNEMIMVSNLCLCLWWSLNDIIIIHSDLIECISVLCSSLQIWRHRMNA